MALRSARAESVHRTRIIRQFFKYLVVWSRSPRVGIRETGVDFLADEDHVHDLVPCALIGKLFGEFQDGVLDLSHRWTSLVS
jgi:hypothetical protein